MRFKYYIVIMLIPRNFITILFLLVITSCGSARKTVSQTGNGIVVDDGTLTPVLSPITNAEPIIKPAVVMPKTYNALQQKYARFLSISPDKITNSRLYGFIDNWLATPYEWGGIDKNGIDCSAFIQKLLSEVYTIIIPRTSIQQFFNNYIEKFKSKDYLSEGDLVFFRTMDDKVVSHVGVYLNNRMFINSSSSKGVSIASLDDPYWKKRYIAAGRVKTNMLLNYNKVKVK